MNFDLYSLGTLKAFCPTFCNEQPNITRTNLVHTYANSDLVCYHHKFRYNDDIRIYDTKIRALI